MNTKITKKHVLIFFSLILVALFLWFRIECNQRVFFQPATETPKDVWDGLRVIGSSVEKKAEYYGIKKSGWGEFKTRSEAVNYCIQNKFVF